MVKILPKWRYFDKSGHTGLNLPLCPIVCMSPTSRFSFFPSPDETISFWGNDIGMKKITIQGKCAASESQIKLKIYF